VLPLSFSLKIPTPSSQSQPECALIFTTRNPQSPQPKPSNSSSRITKALNPSTQISSLQTANISLSIGWRAPLSFRISILVSRPLPIRPISNGLSPHASVSCFGPRLQMPRLFSSLVLVLKNLLRFLVTEKHISSSCRRDACFLSDCPVCLADRQPSLICGALLLPKYSKTIAD
jgi:hypothetical protein